MFLLLVGFELNAFGCLDTSSLPHDELRVLRACGLALDALMLPLVL